MLSDFSIALTEFLWHMYLYLFFRYLAIENSVLSIILFPRFHYSTIILRYFTPLIGEPNVLSIIILNYIGLRVGLEVWFKL